MNSAEKLRLLRQRMQEQGMDAYVVVTDDFHGSEYVGDYFKAREYLSGFTGSAGTLVVLPDSAALWTDGRYFLQAADQLAGSTIDLMRAGQPGVPTIGAFLAQRVPQGGTVGFDGRTVSSLFARTMAAALEGKNVRFAYEQDLAGAVWPDRPALSAQPVWELPAECAGLTREEKLHLLREKMRETGAEVLVLTALDEVAWTLNLRGDDVRCTPVFLSFLLLRQEEATLCVQEQILSGELKEKLAACAGIAHTYMAAEALEAEAAEMHIAIKVETNGADGVKNHLTEQEIENAECIIVAADKAVETARFAGKPVLRVPVSQALKDPEMLLHRALSGTAPLEPEDESVPGMGCNRKAGSAKDGAAAPQEFGRKFYTDLMNGVSHMIPFITGGGILIALSYFLDRGNAGAEMFGRGTSLAMLVRTIGNTSFNLMYVVLAGFIAMSVGDLPALVAGMAGGMLAIQGTSLAPQAEWVSSGFWGAMIAGFAAGFVVKLLRTAFKRLPSALAHIKTVLLYPVASLAVVGFMMVFLVNAPLGRFNTWIYQLLASMQGGSRVVMAAVLGALMAVDFGGPINKAAYLFGTVALAGGQEEFMAAVMAGGMVPPLGVALAGTLFPDRFTTKERHTAMTDYLMGACFITEGVVPFVLRDPLHVIPSCMVGASLAAALSMLFGCAVPAPHGGMFLLPLNPHPFRYLLALLMGSLLTAVTLAVLRRKYPPKDEEQPTN